MKKATKKAEAGLDQLAKLLKEIQQDSLAGSIDAVEDEKFLLIARSGGRGALAETRTRV